MRDIRAPMAMMVRMLPPRYTMSVPVMGPRNDESWKEDWSRPEEDAAWSHLQQPEQ